MFIRSFFVIKEWDLIKGDCYIEMENIPDNSIDLILTDPPYNISNYSTGNIKLPGRKAINNDLAVWDKDEIHIDKLLYQFKRILKKDGNIFIFTSFNLVGKFHQFFDPVMA